MPDFVVDASAAVDALGAKDAVGIALRARLTQSTCHAPHLIDAEVGQAFRRGVHRGDFENEETARTALRALRSMIDHRYSHGGRMTDIAWELRHVVTFYDGLYVALATMLDVPLLTTDLKLANAPDLPCRFEPIQ